MSRKFRYGVLGCGQAAARFFIPGIHASQSAELVAVASREMAKAKDYGRRFGCDAYGSYQDLLARPDINMVYIDLPIMLHQEWTVMALQAGKNVYCEKTLAPSLKETIELLNLAQQRRKRLCEGLMFRFHALNQAALKRVRDGQIGALKSFVGSIGLMLPENDRLRRDFKSKMGALNEIGCYTVAAARMFFGRNPDSVVMDMEYERGADFAGSARLQYDGEGSAFAEFGYDRSPRESCALWGTRGRLTIENCFNPDPALEPVIHLEADGKTQVRIGPENGYAKIIDAFSLAIDSGGGSGDFENEAYQQAVAMEALRMSDRDKIPVIVSEIDTNLVF